MLGIYCRTSREQDIESSTISQQRTAGIKFAEKNNLEYELYEDEGKSGYKISDDEKDPFSNRPAFTKLINDIKDGKIDKVWVWEHSRLARNQFASAFIFNIFEKHNIILYENTKEFKLDDPQLKFTRQVLDAVSEYERQLIVARTTRGIRKRINEGKRWHNALYGYKQEGKDEKGYSVWIPVESEINNYKYILKRYNEGATLLKICYEIYDINKIEKSKFVSYVSNIGQMLRHYQYTGYQLTIEGYDIYKQYRKNDITSLDILLDKSKYWIKSPIYPLELISIEDWIKLIERLQIASKNLAFARKGRLLTARKDIATGLLECGDCGCKYYYKEQKSYDQTKKKEYRCVYYSYYHYQMVKRPVCNQKPLSFKIPDIDEIFKIFYFYFYIVFDNKNDLIKATQRNIKQAQAKLKEKIIKSEKEVKTVTGRLERLTKLMDKHQTDELFETLMINIKLTNDKLDELNNELSKSKIELELQNEKYNQTELEMSYYDVKQRVLDWFYDMTIEEQRNELIRTITSAKIYGRYLLIEAGKVVFLFDINDHHIFNMELLENLNKDEVYKLYFTTMKNTRKAKTFNNRRIADIQLKNNDETRMRLFQYLIKTYNISYDISETTNFISFVSLRGLFSIEVEQFGNEE